MHTHLTVLHIYSSNICQYKSCTSLWNVLWYKRLALHFGKTYRIAFHDYHASICALNANYVYCNIKSIIFYTTYQVNSSEWKESRAMRHFPALTLWHVPLCTAAEAGTPLSTTPCNGELCPSYYKTTIHHIHMYYQRWQKRKKTTGHHAL